MARIFSRASSRVSFGNLAGFAVGALIAVGGFYYFENPVWISVFFLIGIAIMDLTSDHFLVRKTRRF